MPVSALYLLAAPSTPAEVIEAIAERGEQGERLSLAEVKAIIAEVKARGAEAEVVDEDGATRIIEYEVADEEPPQAARGLLLSGGRPKNSPCARSPSRSPTTRERVVVPYYRAAGAACAEDDRGLSEGSQSGARGGDRALLGLALSAISTKMAPARLSRR